MLTYEFIKTLWSLHTDPDLLPMDAQVLTPVHTKAKRFRLKKIMQPIFEAKLLSPMTITLFVFDLVWTSNIRPRYLYLFEAMSRRFRRVCTSLYLTFLGGS